MFKKKKDMPDLSLKERVILNRVAKSEEESKAIEKCIEDVKILMRNQRKIIHLISKIEKVIENWKEEL